MSDDLFPTAVGPSPRLAWMQRHDVVVVRNAKGRCFAVLTCDTVGEGADEDEALTDFACAAGSSTGIWNEHIQTLQIQGR